VPGKWGKIAINVTVIVIIFNIYYFLSADIKFDMSAYIECTYNRHCGENIIY